MNYMSVKEAAMAWGVSARWVQKLCVENRIEGVIRFGHSWMIPKDAKHPSDRRCKNVNTEEQQNV